MEVMLALSSYNIVHLYQVNSIFFPQFNVSSLFKTITLIFTMHKIKYGYGMFQTIIWSYFPIKSSPIYVALYLSYRKHSMLPYLYIMIRYIY